MLNKAAMYLAGKRILISWFFAVAVSILLLISKDCWDANSLMDSSLEFLGIMFICIGMLGRLWASIFIAGYKSSVLVTEGPYSVVRNPLYLFSFIGAAGIGLSTESVLVTLMICAVFLIYYPFVVVQEERQLAEKHGPDFTVYASVTPRFIPDFSLYRQPASYLVSLKHYQRCFWDAGVFLLVYALLQLIEKLHDNGILPILFRIP